MRQPGNNLCADCGAPGEYADKNSKSHYVMADFQKCMYNTESVYILPNFCVAEHFISF